MQSVDLEREKQIGARLRNFREALQISRTKFAGTIGFGSERLASYEAGRVPLRYGVFKSVAMCYQISAKWLATGEGAPRTYVPFDDSPVAELVQPRELFSVTYDTLLKGDLGNTAGTAEMRMEKLVEPYDTNTQYISEKYLTESDRRKVAARLNRAKKKLKTNVETSFIWRKAVKEAFYRNTGLTKVTENDKLVGVKHTLPSLLSRLNKATAVRGMKSKLAKHMGVPLPNVSQWLSGEREPGGETTLKLLNWVEQQERK